MSNVTHAQLPILGYYPSPAFSLPLLVLFSIATVAHVALAIRHKTWYFLILSIGGFLEAFGFAFRVVYADDLYSIPIYTLMMIPILIAPTLLAAADYALVAKLMQKVGFEHRVLTPNVVRYTFLVADILSFVVQMLGAGNMARGSSSRDLALIESGSNTVLAGLTISLVVFVFFSILAIYLFLQVPVSQRNPFARESRWIVLYYLLLINMGLLITRSGYRVAEYAIGGFYNPVSLNQSYFYGMDCNLMLLLMLVWLPAHPGFYDLSPSSKTDSIQEDEEGTITPLSIVISSPDCRTSRTTDEQLSTTAVVVTSDCSSTACSPVAINSNYSSSSACSPIIASCRSPEDEKGSITILV
jgi:hypothetical protein